MKDNHRLKGMRKKLIEELRERGITNEAILNAFDHIHRHRFLDNVFVNQAYSNTAFQIGYEQTISHPYTVAFQTELLKLEPKEKVLEIGTGSGFQTGILNHLGAKVFSVERQRQLYLNAKATLDGMRIYPKLFFGDGYKGLPRHAPFDKILVTCGAPFIPDALLEQLKVGGILVIPLGDGKKQIMTRVIKIDHDKFEKETFGDFSFVPMLTNTQK